MPPLLGLGRLVRPYVGLLLASTLFLTLHALTTGAYAYLVGPLLKFIYTGGESPGSRMTGVLSALGWNIGDNPARLTALMALLIVVLVIIKGFAYFGGSYLVVLASQRMEHRLRLDLHLQVLQISFDRLSDLPKGDMVTRFIQDVAAVKYAVTHGLTNIIRDSLQVLVLIALALYLDPVLGLIALAVLPVSTTVIVRLGQRLRKRRRRAFDAYGELASATEETTAALPVIRAFGAEKQVHHRFEGLSRAILRRNLRAWGIQIFTSPLMELLGALALAATLWYAGRRIGTGAMDPEEFVSFFAAVFMLYRPVKAMGEASAQLHNGLAALDRIRQILALPVEEPDPPDAVDARDVTKSVKFEGVSFSYRDDPVLRGTTFEIAAGETVALVGPSGAGKTTLAHLLLRLLEPQQGRITIDGKDSRGIRRSSLRSLFAYVGQDPVLLHDTVEANISLGLSVDEHQVTTAAEAAGAHHFISELPEGYETSVGEDGARLSGGERQRICIARALLRDTPALILDEATASVDSATEAEITASLEKLMKGRTTLLISHRLSTVKRADRIIVLEDGEVAACGTYEELAAECEPFRRVFKDQLV